MSTISQSFLGLLQFSFISFFCFRIAETHLDVTFRKKMAFLMTSRLH